MRASFDSERQWLRRFFGRNVAQTTGTAAWAKSGLSKQARPRDTAHQR